MQSATIRQATGTWKRMLLAGALFVTSIHAFAQAPASNRSRVYPDSMFIFKYMEKLPEFPGNINTWLAENIRIPERSAAMPDRSKVVVQFIILPDGTVTSPMILCSSGVSRLDEEAMRLVRIMPRWQPGHMGKRPVAAYYAVPVIFRFEHH